MSDGSTDVSVQWKWDSVHWFCSQWCSILLFSWIGWMWIGKFRRNYNAFKKVLHFKNISVENILKETVAGDGASANTGHLNGVIAHFRRNVSQSIIMVQCMSRRFELAYKAALKVRIKTNFLISNLLNYLEKFIFN